MTTTRGKPIGSIVGLTVSWWHGGEWPREGDVLETSGSAYLILEVHGKSRPTKLVCVKIDKFTIAKNLGENGRIWEWEWKKRERKKSKKVARPARESGSDRA